MTRPAGAPLRRALAAVGLALALTGCSALPGTTGLDQLPLPGGADLGSDPYQVTAEFADVLSLVPQSAVKVNDVAVGRVTRIRLDRDGWTAHVTMKINGSVRLPADAHAALEQSSLLGEKYVQLSAPPARPGTDRAGSAPRLRDGSAIPLARTNRNPEVEEVFGALSLLLNGGGVEQIKNIATELNRAIGGRETQVRSVLRRIDTLVTSLDRNKANITAALDGVNRLAATLAARRTEIGRVLTGVAPGLKVLEDQRGSLLTMLRALDTLATVAVDTIERGKDDTIADLKALGPVLTALADSGRALPESLQVLLTYPFTDEVLKGIKGDYLNAYLRVTARPGTEIIPALTPPRRAPRTTAGSGTTPPLPLPAVTPATGEEQR
ncbi:MCE family protein [Streptomyces yaizuensis]|uniref:MlaD family protein n=1 Tax=Streptomyces yaizuensis TaxID=2989713 RepID=A0ABQ5P721_9ACTN|nr:MCE family protein [Streptomyces sp. YSPA8]GLF98386.1 MlaD family protein [Streptomyces sp. YSPA8]